MKIWNTIWMSGAASVLAVSAGAAADLPSRKAAPVEYVRVCSTMGEGFFYIPGTDTCLRIGGRLRAEFGYAEPLWTTAPGSGRSNDATGFRARGRLNIDARTSTDYGLLRAYLRYEITRDSGPFVGSGFNGAPTSNGAVVTTAALDQGYVQFGGLTAGRVQSFFDFYADDTNWGLALGSDVTTQSFAYTASFGTGFSATLAIEDRTERQTVSTLSPLYGGTRMPDVVANLRADQAWGSAQLSGAVHQINTPNTAFGGSADSEYGWAVQAGVQLKLDQLAPGDVLWLQAAYADGAVSYLGLSPTRVGSLNAGVYETQYDFAYNAAGGIEKTSGYSLVASFVHYWSPVIRQGLYGGYNRYTVDSPLGLAYGAVLTPGVGAAPFAARDLSVWQVGTQVVWSPAKDLDIGAEVGYTKVDPQGRVSLAPVLAATRGQESQWQGRIRVQRDF